MKKFSGLLIVFVVITVVAFVLKNLFTGLKIDYKILIGANVLLFFLGVISLVLHSKALLNPNPNVFVRSVLMVNIIKLVTLASAAFILISAMGNAVNANVIFAILFLYIVYTWIEKRATIQLSKSKK